MTVKKSYCRIQYPVKRKVCWMRVCRCPKPGQGRETAGKFWKKNIFLEKRQFRWPPKGTSHRQNWPLNHFSSKKVDIFCLIKKQWYKAKCWRLLLFLLLLLSLLLWHAGRRRKQQLRTSWRCAPSPTPLPPSSRALLKAQMFQSVLFQGEDFD